MAKQKQVKIDTNAAERQSGLHSAFSDLALDGLPEGKPPAAEPSAPEPESKASPQPGRVVLRREKAHRGGKTVIVIDGFAPELDSASLERLAKQLRVALGCGGTAKDRHIEIQGDQPGKVRSVLEQQGFRVAGER